MRKKRGLGSASLTCSPCTLLCGCTLPAPHPTPAPCLPHLWFRGEGVRPNSFFPRRHSEGGL